MIQIPFDAPQFSYKSNYHTIFCTKEMLWKNFHPENTMISDRGRSFLFIHTKIDQKWRLHKNIFDDKID